MNRTAIVMAGVAELVTRQRKHRSRTDAGWGIPNRDSLPPGNIFAVQCDVRSADAVGTAFLAIEGEPGAMEIVVVNVGDSRDRLLLSIDEDDLATMVDTNLTGAFHVAKGQQGDAAR